MQQKDFGVIQKVCSLKTSNFRPAPPCSSLFILHAGCLWIFLNEKLRSEKREKNYFFCKLNIKDGNVFNTDIYTITAIKIFTFSYIYKKNVYVVLIKLSATTTVWKIRQFFHRVSIEINLTPTLPSPCLFSFKGFFGRDGRS